MFHSVLWALSQANGVSCFDCCCDSLLRLFSLSWRIYFYFRFVYIFFLHIRAFQMKISCAPKYLPFTFYFLILEYSVLDFLLSCCFAIHSRVSIAWCCYNIIVFCVVLLSFFPFFLMWYFFSLHFDHWVVFAGTHPQSTRDKIGENVIAWHTNCTCVFYEKIKPQIGLWRNTHTHTWAWTQTQTLSLQCLRLCKLLGQGIVVVIMVSFEAIQNNNRKPKSSCNNNTEAAEAIERIYTMWMH